MKDFLKEAMYAAISVLIVFGIPLLIAGFIHWINS